MERWQALAERAVAALELAAATYAYRYGPKEAQKISRERDAEIQAHVKSRLNRLGLLRNKRG